MKTTATYQAEQTLLYLLTGDSRKLRDVFPKKRGVKRRKLASKAPTDSTPPKKKRRQPVHNLHMDIEQAHQRFIEQGHMRSHSHKVGHIAKVNGFRLMSNYQEGEPKMPRELPYHREFTQADWNHANVGPQPVRN